MNTEVKKNHPELSGEDDKSSDWLTSDPLVGGTTPDGAFIKSQEDLATNDESDLGLKKEK